MNAIIERAHAELVDDTPFFAPVDSDVVDGLVGQYNAMRARMERLSAMVAAETEGAIQYFLDGNIDRHSRYAPPAASLFKLPGAVAALNSAYWSKALAMTDVIDCMPQKRRDEWHQSISDKTTPDFAEDTVRATIGGMLSMRAQFLSERVDGIFRGLSGEHVTNAPEAFGRRMILAHALNEYGSSSYSSCGLINDLRCVIAKFMGRDEPGHSSSARLIQTLRNNWGEWTAVDGGALRIRLYRKGTAHIEVHPDMAWRLNSVLAHMHPLAIPAQFRQQPKKRVKAFALMTRPLPFAVLAILEGSRPRPGGKSVTLASGLKAQSSAAWEEAAQVLQAIGGARIAGNMFEFDYDPCPVLDEIMVSGGLPDQKSHQFYPTPRALAQRVVALADIQPGTVVLEPSAGQGGLASLLPAGAVCVEVSPLNCAVLQGKGHDVVQADFLQWAGATSRRFDRVVMNPPFSEGRWQAHTRAAAALLQPGGVLVAVVPASAANGFALPGCAVECSSPIEGAFPGVSVTVVILRAVHDV